MLAATQTKPIAQRISEAKTRIAARHVFWGSILLMAKMVATKQFNALAATDYRNIFYDPDWMQELPDKQIAGVLIHEVLHIVFLHNLRRGNRKPRKWNSACDYAINLVVIDMGYELPHGALVNHRYKGKTAEEIYDLLPEEPEKGFDILLEVPIGPGGFSSEKEAREYVKDLIAQAYALHEKSNGRGTLPGDVEDYIKDLLKPQVPWQRKLHRYAGLTIGRDDYSMFPPSRRHLAMDIIMPSLRSYKIGGLIINIDDSGSISKQQLQAFASEMPPIASLTEEVTVIISDAQVQQVIRPERIDEFLRNLTFKGRGGTDHNPVFQYIEEQKLRPELFIGFTDGESSFPPAKPKYPVLWCLTSQSSCPPWGETLYIDA